MEDFFDLLINLVTNGTKAGFIRDIIATLARPSPK